MIIFNFSIFSSILTKLFFVWKKTKNKYLPKELSYFSIGLSNRQNSRFLLSVDYERGFGVVSDIWFVRFIDFYITEQFNSFWFPIVYFSDNFCTFFFCLRFHSCHSIIAKEEQKIHTFFASLFRLN